MSEHNDFPRFFEAATQLFKLRQLPQAAEQCAKALTLNPQDIECLHLCASIAEAMKRFPEAEATWARAVQLNPRGITARFGLGKIQLRLGKLHDAVSSYTAGLSEVLAHNTDDKPMACMRACIQGIIDRSPALGPVEADWIIEFGVLLEATGHYEHDGAPLLAFTRDNLAAGKLRAFQLLLVIHALAFKIASARAWNSQVFESLVRPGLEAEVQAGRFRIVLELENLIYVEFIKQEETQTNFQEHYVAVMPLLRTAGLAARSLNRLSERHATSNHRPVVAFLLRTPSLLAHTQVLLAYLQGYRNLPDQPFLPSIYIFSGREPNCERILRASGANVFLLDEIAPETKYDDYSRLLALRQRLEHDNVTCVVWISLPISMVFASALHMAPVQVWWSMKHHGIETPDLDGYVTGGSLMRTKRIGERVWRTAPVAYRVEFDATIAAKAGQLRSQFPKFRLLLGTLAREQKLIDKRFLDSVIQILKDHTDIAYLWTGATRLNTVQSAFERAGVADRCYFVGWVDTKIYAQLLDIFLDSFPFPCTFTLVEAMAAGKAAVFYQSEESYRTGIHGILSPMLDDSNTQDATCRRVREIFQGKSGRSLYLCAQNPEEYVHLAEQLIADDSFRNEVGIALKQVVHEYFINNAAMAEGYTDHFMEIIRETLSHAMPR